MIKYSLYIEWLEKAKTLQAQEELLFPAASAEEQKQLTRILRKELKNMQMIDPVEASSIEVHKKFKDYKHWVTLKKIAGTPLIAFKKGVDGKIERVAITLTGREKRLLKLMKADGLTVERAQKLLNRKLTKEEVEEFQS